MIHVMDASEGSFDSGRYAEAEALCALGEGRVDDAVLIGARSAVLDGLGVSGRIVSAHLAMGPLPAGQRVGGASLKAWGREPARWALRQSAAIDLSVELLEGPTRVTRETQRWARALSDFRQVTVRDEADGRAWLSCGVAGARLRHAGAEVPAAALDRGELRARLEVDEDEFLIMPIAAPWCSLDAQRLVFLLGLLRIDGVRSVALVPASSWKLASARHFRKVAGTGARLIAIDGAMTPWLGACDAAFLDAARPRDRLRRFAPRGALRVLIAAARGAGVPLAVAPGSLLEERPTAAPSVAAELRPLARIGEAWTAGMRGTGVALA